MNIDDIERLMRLAADTGLDEVEIRQGGVHLRFARHAPPTPMAARDATHPHPHAPLPWQGTEAGPAHAGVAAPPPPAEDDGLHVITSSMVGTFYRRPNPEAAPFVKEGDEVKKGQVVCLLEAMKILNEIESDMAGVVVGVHAEDGQPVEYGEKLFSIRPR